ncbi:MAG: hypothetical protein ACFB0C_09030 [Leptolyngbyaceae cyanobacterium]
MRNLIAVGLLQIGFVIWVAYPARLYGSLIWGVLWLCPLVFAHQLLP